MITERILDEIYAEIIKIVIYSPDGDFFNVSAHSSHFIDLCWTFCRDDYEY